MFTFSQDTHLYKIGAVLLELCSQHAMSLVMSLMCKLPSACTVIMLVFIEEFSSAYIKYLSKLCHCSYYWDIPGKTAMPMGGERT